MAEATEYAQKEVEIGKKEPDFKDLASKARDSPHSFAAFRNIEKNVDYPNAMRYFSAVAEAFKGAPLVYAELKPEIKEIAKNAENASPIEIDRFMSGIIKAYKQHKYDFGSMCYDSSRVSFGVYCPK